MGSGKSSTGRALSKLLGLTFVDIDERIINLSGLKSINEIFENHNESFFRDLERKALIETLKQTNQVIATGGGTLIYNPPSVLKKSSDLNDQDLVILLDASFNTCVDRCKHSNRRPLFRDLEKAKKLYDERLPIYQEIANIKIKIDNLTSKVVAAKLKDFLKL